jgi:hypothetical protein
VIELVLAAGALASSGLLAWSSRGRRAEAADGVRRRAIGEVGDGRFLVRGRIVPIETAASAIDGARCVYVLRGSVDPEHGIVRDVAYELEAFPFRVEDETGVIEIDPRVVVIDAPPHHGEAGLVVEHRLRADEEVEVIACFRASPRGSMPYRATAPLLEPVPDASDPPRVTPTRETIASTIVPSVDRALARAAAAAVLGASVVLAWLIG